jgi:hypothetical protein
LRCDAKALRRMCAAEWRVEWYGVGLPRDAMKRRTGRRVMGDGVRGMLSLPFLRRKGAGWRELGDGVGGLDRGGESGTVGDADRFIDKLSRLSSATSSIRESRLRDGGGQSESDAVGDSGLLRSLEALLLLLSNGLFDLDLDLDCARDGERDRDMRASSLLILAALRLAIACDRKVVAQHLLRRLKSGGQLDVYICLFFVRVRGTGTEHKESHRNLDDKPWSSCVIFGQALALGRFRNGWDPSAKQCVCC